MGTALKIICYTLLSLTNLRNFFKTKTWRGNGFRRTFQSLFYATWDYKKTEDFCIWEGHIQWKASWWWCHIINWKILIKLLRILCLKQKLVKSNLSLGHYHGFFTCSYFLVTQSKIDKNISIIALITNFVFDLKLSHNYFPVKSKILCPQEFSLNCEFCILLRFLKN